MRPAVRPVAAPRCAAAQMSLPSRRSVVAGAFSAVLFGSEAQARGAPAAAPAAKDPNAIDWAELGLSREALGLPPDPNAKKEEAPNRGQRVSPAPAGKPKAGEKPAPVKPAEKSKSKPAEKPKAAEKPAAKSVAKPAAKGKNGKAKPKNDLGLDFDEMGLSKEALGLAPPKKKAGPQKPPKPGEKPKAAPKPKPKPTRKQIEEKSKKDRARAEKVSARPCA